MATYLESNAQGNLTDRTWTRTVYRYQDPIYTYYFYKTENLESFSDPTGGTGVSNVVKWVKYREK